ncbi:alpha-glucan family phosphorylase [Methanoculleus submarinus]|uniref:glycogen phosphorylase n=1 Tax=Methanoculleus submarinus TaxID=204050 RepID=A0AAX3E643_9EURY|nr:alpha-glucan family phosphorylase [Methanoculleus submarinus]UYU17399.1 alpha-glucan family phosphorylase [Methanoculleus submarinus]
MKTEIPYDRFAHVPERIFGLVDLAYNLWWSWHSSASVLFKMLNRAEWKMSRHNPVRMLLDTPPRFFERAAANPEYLRRYDIIMHRFGEYMVPGTSWFAQHYPSRTPLTIAYLSSEFGLHHSLPFYAGGLGILAGDHVKASSDLGVPTVAVGFMYAEGYLHQHIEADGWQKNVAEILDRDAAPVLRVMGDDGKQLVVQVPLIDPPIYVAVWKVQVGRVPLYLLDTHIDENLPENRNISHRLYLKELECRLRQELVLGIGGRKVLHTLGVEYSAMHLNEGHSAFSLLERLRERLVAGMPPDEAREQVRGTSVFTTHTPVPAAHDVFPEDLMAKYFRSYCPSLDLAWDEFMALGDDPHNPGAGFNMTAFALRMSRFHNGVSKKHGEVAREMWQPLWPDLPPEEVPIDAVTNGVHVPTWLNHRIEALIDRYMDPDYPNWREDYDNPIIWEVVDEIPDEELWREHQWLKMKLFSRIRDRKRRKWAGHQGEPANLAAEGLMLDTSALTIGFARRFAEYKRADLIFEDLDRLDRIVNNRWRPVQFIFAGKAHPADDRGKRILQKIYQYSQDPRFGGRIAFIEDYGEQVARYMVHGVDVWMNTPVPLMEASGTSGMKAGMNGVLNLSVLDGWWVEGYNGRNGWGFEGHAASPGDNRADAETIYDLIENEVAPLYYSRTMDDVPHKWVRMMRESIKSIAPQYCSLRMLKEYVTRYYPSVCRYAAGPGEQLAGLEGVCPPGPAPRMR